jgi:hypothetical protein
VIRQSGRKADWRRTYGGDKALKRVFYQGAFCAVCHKDPLSKAFYDRKRRERKHHTQALIALWSSPGSVDSYWLEFPRFCGQLLACRLQSYLGAPFIVDG